MENFHQAKVVLINRWDGGIALETKCQRLIRAMTRQSSFRTVRPSILQDLELQEVRQIHINQHFQGLAHNTKTKGSQACVDQWVRRQETLLRTDSLLGHYLLMP